MSEFTRGHELRAAMEIRAQEEARIAAAYAEQDRRLGRDRESIRARERAALARLTPPAPVLPARQGGRPPTLDEVDAVLQWVADGGLTDEEDYR